MGGSATQGLWQHMETVLVVTTWGVLLGRPGDAAEHPTSQRAAMTMKKGLAYNVSSQG